MKCNNCGYNDGWDPEQLKVIEGDYGKFYKLPIKLVRDTPYCGEESVSMIGCPQCGNVQIEKHLN